MFFGHCHRTRFRDSFCLASVFEMTVYLLTYLLTYVESLIDTHSTATLYLTGDFNHLNISQFLV